MSFSPEWLALREPADHASVSQQIRNVLRDRFASADSVRVVDLGCGAGSNLRGTSSALPARQQWTLVDYDPTLLAAAKERMSSVAGPIEIAYRQADLSAGDFGPLLDGADLVTAAALFDLVSQPVIEKLAAAVAARRQAFYTVLTYDGIASWLPGHPADVAMRDAFNAHQRRDKGFGPAAGPAATGALASAFESHGYTVYRGSSPWVLDDRFARLRDELDKGFAGAVGETGRVDAATVNVWLAARAAAPSRVTVIGHEDLFAVPA